MQFENLEASLAATALANEGGRLGRFLSLDSEQALAEWLQLDPEQPTPTRSQVLSRLEADIVALDEHLGAQLDVILHAPAFQRLEASWRGLCRLTAQVQGPEENVKIRLLDASWKELVRDLERAIEFDQSQLFRKVYSAEFDTPGGEPFGVLLGDYEIQHRRSKEHPEDDVSALRSISQVAAASFAPFLTAAHPNLFGLESWHEMDRPIHWERTFRNEEYAAWNRLRAESDARFLGVLLPRTLMRRRWSCADRRDDGFYYNEQSSSWETHLWGSSVYAFGEVLIRTFIENGWMARIRGVMRDVEGEGLVTTLAHDWFPTDPPELVSKGSMEVHLTGDQEKELGDLGFIVLTHCHGTRFAAFYGNQSIQSWSDPQAPTREATVAEINAKLSSMLQYMFCVSRFAHYVKVICRDKLGSYTEASVIENHLNDWLVRYATSNESASDEQQAKYPLRDARVEVREVAGQPGVFQSVVHLQPHYQLDQMTSAVRLVTEIYSGHDI